MRACGSVFACEWVHLNGGVLMPVLYYESLWVCTSILSMNIILPEYIILIIIIIIWWKLLEEEMSIIIKNFYSHQKRTKEVKRKNRENKDAGKKHTQKEANQVLLSPLLGY